MTARLWIVRHGNTFEPGETPRRVGSRTDPPLTAGGREQAAALHRWFRDQGIRFDDARVSPLRRTRETAALILGETGPAPRPCDWLAEIDHGPDENRTEAEVIGRIGAAALARWDAEAVPPPGWIVGGPARVAAWRGLFSEAADSDADQLIVTSNGAARFALLALPTPAIGARTLKLRTGAWGRIAIDGGVPRLDVWDRRP